MLITVNDRVSYAITKREYTDEGFLKVPGRVARTGIQEYLASELGLTDRAPNDIVRVMRPPEEVFNDESLATYNASDITVEHPEGMVSAVTFKNVSVGTVVGAGSQDGDFVTCDLIIKDKAAIDAVQSGKVQLSAGYSAVYDDDVPPDAGYDFIQRSIKINHVALVDRARAGVQACLFDGTEKETAMFKVMLGDGRTVEVADQATATLINDTISQLTKSVADTKTELDTVKAVSDAGAETITELKAATSDSAIADKVKTIIDATTIARKIAGDDFTCDSLVLADIQRAALGVKRESVDWAAKSDVYVQAAFDQASEKADEDEGDDDKKKSASDSANAAQLAQLAQDAAGSSQQKKDPRANYMDGLSTAFRKTIGEDS